MVSRWVSDGYLKQANSHLRLLLYHNTLSCVKSATISAAISTSHAAAICSAVKQVNGFQYLVPVIKPKDTEHFKLFMCQMSCLVSISLNYSSFVIPNPIFKPYFYSLLY